MNTFFSWIESIWFRKREELYWKQHLQHIVSDEPLSMMLIFSTNLITFFRNPKR